MEDIRRRGSVVYFKKPKIIEEITPEVKKLERKILNLEKRGLKFIEKEKRKKGIIPTILRYEERGEKEYEKMEKIQRMRILKNQIRTLQENIGKMSYNQLLNELKTIDEDYAFIKERQAFVKKRDKTPEEKLIAFLQGQKPLEMDELVQVAKAHDLMKKMVLGQLVHKEREMKKLGKII
jgi:hypothetical protein